MPCSVSDFPGLVLNNDAITMSSSIGRRHTRLLETSLILSRVPEATREEKKDEQDKQRVGLTALDFRIRRDERRRRLFRVSSFRSQAQEEELEPEPEPPKEPKKETVVKDRFGNEVYVRGETAQDKMARELDQWVKKMKCDGSSMGLKQFAEIKVGVYQSEVVYGSPSHEPYPDLAKETASYTYTGGKDNQKRFHGKGTIEFEDGSFVMGYWLHGIRHGHFKVETNRNSVCFLDGEYSDNKLNGKARIHFNDDTWIEGFFKDGVLHGFCRYFDNKNRLTFLGMHRNGRPFGTCWKIIRGCNIAYIYPDFKTALVGTFKDGELVGAQVAEVKKVLTDNFSIKVPQFTEPEGRLYRKEVSTYTSMTTSPTLPDPYESNMVEVRKSGVPGAHQGIFAKRNVQPNTILAFYNGMKLDPLAAEAETWEKTAYRIFDPSVKSGTVDIPEEYRSLENYCASLAHKTNHSFVPNSEFTVFHHPRFGKIPCIASIHAIAKDEEIFVRYGYELDYCPEWYLEAWEKGNYPVPDSMKAEYGAAPHWANSTNDDKQNQLPETL